MKVWSLIFAILCLNLASWSISVSGVFPVTRELWLNPTDITSQFSLSVFLIAFAGIGGAVIGLLGAIFRQFTYAAGAILIWVVMLLLPFLQWIIGGIPIMMYALLPPEISWFGLVVGAFFAAAFFMFILEIAGGRQIT